MIKKINHSLLSDVYIVELNNIVDETGKIIVVEKGPDYSFNLERLFFVYDIKGARRGDHAHKECIQLLICINGSAEIIVDDGKNKKSFILDKACQGLLIPPSIWSWQNYLDDETILIVLCNKAYDENDYIRSYNDFISYRQN